MQTLPVASAPPALPTTMTYKQLCGHLRALRIPAEAWTACKTFGALHKLIKPQYHHLAHQYHPDRRAHQETFPAPDIYTTSPRHHHTVVLHLHGGQLTRGQPLRGYTFRKLTRHYHTLMAVPPATLLPQPATFTSMMEQELRDLTRLRLSIHAISLSGEHPLPLSAGWQEARERYWY